MKKLFFTLFAFYSFDVFALVLSDEKIKGYKDYIEAAKINDEVKMERLQFKYRPILFNDLESDCLKENNLIEFTENQKKAYCFCKTNQLLVNIENGNLRKQFESILNNNFYKKYRNEIDKWENICKNFPK